MPPHSFGVFYPHLHKTPILSIQLYSKIWKLWFINHIEANDGVRMLDLFSNYFRLKKLSNLKVGDKLFSKSEECSAEITQCLSIDNMLHYNVTISKNGVSWEKTISPFGLTIAKYNLEKKK